LPAERPALPQQLCLLPAVPLLLQHFKLLLLLLTLLWLPIASSSRFL
jgi:hypothetical protein